MYSLSVGITKDSFMITQIFVDFFFPTGSYSERFNFSQNSVLRIAQLLGAHKRLSCVFL